MTNYMKHVYTYFIVETFTFKLQQNHFINLSNQRLIWPQKANAVTSTSCTMIIHLISLLQLDMQKNGGKQMSTMDFLRKLGYKTYVPTFYKINEDKIDPTLLPPVS